MGFGFHTFRSSTILSDLISMDATRSVTPKDLCSSLNRDAFLALAVSGLKGQLLHHWVQAI